MIPQVSTDVINELQKNFIFDATAYRQIGLTFVFDAEDRHNFYQGSQPVRIYVADEKLMTDKKARAALLGVYGFLQRRDHPFFPEVLDTFSEDIFRNNPVLVVRAGHPVLAHGEEVAEPLSVVRGLFGALGALHAKDKLHGWLSAETIEVDSDGKPFLGLMALGVEQPSAVHVREPGYWPSVNAEPEASKATDVYGAGMLAHRLLLGQAGFRAAFLGGGTESDAAWEDYIAVGEEPSLRDHSGLVTVPEKVAYFLKRMIARDASKRIATMTEAARGLEASLSTAAGPPPPPPPPNPDGKKEREQSKLLIYAGGGALALMIAGFGWKFMNDQEAQRIKDAQQAEMRATCALVGPAKEQADAVGAGETSSYTAAIDATGAQSALVQQQDWVALKGLCEEVRGGFELAVLEQGALEAQAGAALRFERLAQDGLEAPEASLAALAAAQADLASGAFAEAREGFGQAASVAEDALTTHWTTMADAAMATALAAGADPAGPSVSAGMGLIAEGQGFLDAGQPLEAATALRAAVDRFVEGDAAARTRRITAAQNAFEAIRSTVAEWVPARLDDPRVAELIAASEAAVAASDAEGVEASLAEAGERVATGAREALIQEAFAALALARDAGAGESPAFDDLGDDLATAMETEDLAAALAALSEAQIATLELARTTAQGALRGAADRLGSALDEADRTTTPTAPDLRDRLASAANVLAGPLRSEEDFAAMTTLTRALLGAAATVEREIALTRDRALSARDRALALRDAAAQARLDSLPVFGEVEGGIAPAQDALGAERFGAAGLAFGAVADGFDSLLVQLANGEITLCGGEGHPSGLEAVTLPDGSAFCIQSERMSAEDHLAFFALTGADGETSGLPREDGSIGAVRWNELPAIAAALSAQTGEAYCLPREEDMIAAVQSLGPETIRLSDGSEWLADTCGGSGGGALYLVLENDGSTSCELNFSRTADRGYRLMSGEVCAAE